MQYGLCFMHHQMCGLQIIICMWMHMYINMTFMYLPVSVVLTGEMSSILAYWRV